MTREFDPRFFMREDVPVDGPLRELVGYGEHPPKVRWKDDARVAVQIVVNVEEGSEKTFAMGDGTNDGYHEFPDVVEGQRDLAVESYYEYGSRAGIWRLFRVFDAAGIPVTHFAAAVALERNPEVAAKLARRGDEAAGHGYRWSNHFEMNRDEEREAIRRAVLSIERTTGSRPVGWYCREMSVNTRELVVEEGGFLYDSDCYNDDLPYWSRVLGRPHLVVPYGLVVNDARYVTGNGFASPEHFYEMAKAHLDRLRADGDDVSRMMSIGLHPRITGNPARADALARFISYAQSLGDVWFATRAEIARTFIEQQPADRWLGDALTREAAAGEELVSLVTCDLAGLVRGRSVPLSEIERRLEIGVGWVPANQSISAFGDLAEPNPWGSAGDLRLMPAPTTRVRLDRWPDVAPLHLVLCDIAEVDGSDWDACGRTFLRRALDRLHRHTGLRVRAAFEHEFVLEAPGAAAPAFSLEAQRLAEPFGSQVMAALREAGVEPEAFLPEYGERQFEIPIAPAAGVTAADRSVIFKEVVREVARRLGTRVSFAPLRDAEGVGTGAHIHVSLVDEAGRPAGYDAARPAGLSLHAGRFAAGILQHLPAVLALTAPSPHSFARLVPHRWSAAAAVLGERNREAALRICPVVPLGGMTAQGQLHLEFRAADATASPYLALGALVCAGLEGIRHELEPPPVVEAGAPIEAEPFSTSLPRSLEAALDALEADPQASSWLPPRLLETYLGLKRLELALVADLDLEEVCRLYASVH